MDSTTNKRPLSVLELFLLLSVAVLALAAGSTRVRAQTDTAQTSPTDEPIVLDWINAIEADDAGFAHPAGLAFAPDAQVFYLLEGQPANAEDAAPSSPTTIRRLDAYGDLIDTVELNEALDTPVNVTFDSRANRLLIYRQSGPELLAIPVDDTGALDLAALTRYDAQAFGVQNAQGMAFDSVRGDLYLLDSAAAALVRVTPGADGSFANATVAQVDLSAAEIRGPHGLAFDPTTDRLLVLSPPDRELVQLTLQGEVVDIQDLVDFQLNHTQGLVVAPTRDTTDPDDAMHIYIADSGAALREAEVDNPAPSAPGDNHIYLPQIVIGMQVTPLSDAGEQTGQSEGSPTGLGQIVELAFVPLASAEGVSGAAGALVQAAAFTSSLVRTTQTSNFSPPSPDPSGIAYLPDSGTLLIADGEVDEMGIFEGDNLFESSLSGSLVDSFSSLDFSDEPSGLDINPANNHLFITDDTGTRAFYELDPGPDGRYGTSDDQSRRIRTAPFGSRDPEGITFVSQGAGILFIVDGVNREVYRLTPGSNGIFDGVAPDGDDQVTHFDTLSFGLDDPEGIVFDPASGHLYLVGKPPTTVFEVTTNGTLVQTIDISAANARKPAGLALGPSSQNPNVTSLYIVDRGVDNDSNPNENDGKFYEMTLPSRADNPPVANNDSAATNAGTPVNINVAANDSDPDNNLVPSTANTTCSGCSTPSHGTLTNNGNGTFTYAPNAGFTGSDSFVYQICDSTGLCDTATVNITVSASNAPPVANNDSASTDEDTAVNINVAANDTDPDGNLAPNTATTNCSACSTPSHGTLTNNGNGSFTYQPAANYNGSDSFVYRICDSVGLCDTATVNITVNPVPDPPDAADDAASTTVFTPVIINSAANDTDPDGNLAPSTSNTTCSGCSAPGHGNLSNNGNGTFTYAPSAGFSGSDSFVYQICDTTSLCDTATVNISVNAGGPHTLNVQVAASTDDAEEKPTGGMRLGSSDLELVTDGAPQTVGIRFTNLTIPPGATIVNAYVQFTVDQVNSEPTALTIKAQASDNPPTFADTKHDISSRSLTSQSVTWSPAPWLTKRESGPNQRTPNLAPLIQAIVNRSGWASGNALVLIITGSGVRSAEAFDGVPASAPILHIEYQ